MTRNKLVRIYGHQHLHFITFSRYRRKCLLGAPGARNMFVKILGAMRTRFDFRLVGYVVMAEHVHLLIGEPRIGNPSKVMQALKQLTSSKMRGDGEPHFWMPRFYDFNVWSNEKKIEKLDYMHNNPVKRGLVRDPKDWQWSSYGSYLPPNYGLIAIDLKEVQNPHP